MLTFSQFDHLSDELVSGDHRWLDVPGVILVPCRVRQVSDSGILIYMQPSQLWVYRNSVAIARATSLSTAYY